MVSVALTLPLAAQSAGFRSVRPVEFHLADEKPSPGFIAASLPGEAIVVYLHPRIELDDRDIVTASVVTGPDGGPAVKLKLTRSGVRKLNALVDRYQLKFQRLAIMSADRIVSAPFIEGWTVGDSIDILGISTQRDAIALAQAIANGRSK
jgi:preprotein translocase subunit SecD